MNPRQWNKHIKIFNEKEQQRIKEKDTLNYLLGKYIAYSFNDPKHYPNEPFTDTNEKKLKPISDDEMEQIAKYNTAMMGGVINDN